MNVKKLILLICTALFISIPFYTIAINKSSPNEHVIMFGDSIVDTGNYPEPANVHSPGLSNFNLYVPITNPVNVSDEAFKAFLLASLSPAYQQGKIDDEAKAKHSANWPLYLTYKLNAQPLITWYAHEEKDSPVININYAWASAVAGNPRGTSEPTGECFHDDGSPFPGNCNTDTLISNKQLYLAHTSENPNYDKYTDIQIPDLGKQISSYLDDKSVSLKTNTTFFIYIGANDIGNFLKANLIKAVLEPSSMFKKTVEQQMPIIANHVNEAIQRLELAYTNVGKSKFQIYLLTLPNFNDLHEGYTYTHPSIFGKPTWLPGISPRIENAMTNAQISYNQNLEAVAAKYHNVFVINMGDYLDKLAASSVYKDSVKNGTVCIEGPAYTTPQANGTNNCKYENKQERTVIYFSWNNAHFSSPVNQQIASYIYKELPLVVSDEEGR